MIIYKVTNIVNGKCYVGKTINFKKRLWKYKSDVKLKKYPNIILHNAIRKYGWNNFQWEILKNNIDDVLILNVIETFMIMIHSSHISEGGYNMTWGGEGGDTFTNNPRKNELRKIYSNQNKGKHPSEETKERMRISAKTRPPVSEETKRKKSISMMGKNLGDSNGARKPGIGKKISEILKNRNK